MSMMSGKAAAASVCGFLAVWWGYFFLVSHWPFGDSWSEPERWTLSALSITAVVVSIGVGIACGAWVDTRRKDDE